MSEPIKVDKDMVVESGHARSMAGKRDEMKDAIDRIFAENQAVLPEADRASKPFCMEERAGFRCTKAKGHTEDHVAHGTLGTIVCRWVKCIFVNDENQ